MGVCNCSMFYCTLLYVHSCIAIILMGKRELIALLNLSSWCLVMVERLILAVPRGCLQFVIVVFPDHTHLLFLSKLPKRTLRSVDKPGGKSAARGGARTHDSGTLVRRSNNLSCPAGPVLTTTYRLFTSPPFPFRADLAL